MLFNSTPSERRHTPPFNMYGTGTLKHVVDEVTYLGLTIDNKCSAKAMMSTCLKNARAAYHRALAFTSLSHIHHACLLRTVCTSTILSTALYGLEVWGPDILPSMRAFDNDIQDLVTKFFKHGLRLPRRTARIIVTLESGCPFVHSYCLRYISKTIARWEKNGPPVIKSIMEADTTMHHWRTYITTKLGLYWPASSHPYPSTVVRAAERLVYDPHLENSYSATCRDVRAEQCDGRIIATYIQNVWNGQYGRPHPVLMTPTIPCRDYRWWLRVRTLTFPAPAYTHHFSATGSHYCNLGCVESWGDLLHLLSECPYACIAQPSPTMPPHQLAFFSKSMDPHDAARQATLLCDRLRNAHTGSASAELHHNVGDIGQP